ncbi:unnamed protein product [Rotaria magnacalcarata]|uniref:Uncharacterized protein n=1 Tax=Rotaria magnacalcarata TaxID=392030 RepID=A0A815R8Q6_9BILA|nr:unnamed protein product [Rotaria magnacalcarata]CAF1473499.1 unnamed protein product [Rotaria magnacalcarata]CAF3973922.1 unnamed protein product [Rotaria magnacalcarata]CAF3990007.1 unnamed protein product [Rotaria magnacalcarata]CAF4742206.1 unnamed protein product [Rotaria magnacalcarata]
MNTRLLVNLIHEFLHIFVRSYSKNFSCCTPHRIDSFEGGYLFEKQIFGIIKSKFWFDDNCCELLFDENTWLLSTNNCLFTNDMLSKLDNMSQTDPIFRSNLRNIHHSGLEYGINKRLTYD